MKTFNLSSTMKFIIFFSLFSLLCIVVSIPSILKKQNFQISDQLRLYLGPVSEPEMGFDPILGWANVDGVSPFHSFLINEETDFTFSLDLAHAYKISKDGQSYTFTLRPDIYFSDGTKLTSEDVAFTFNKAVSAGVVGNLGALSKIETPTNRKVIFHLSQPNALFLHSISRMGIVPKHAYSKNYKDHPIGSGPYTLETWERKRFLLAKANPFYYKNIPEIKNLKIFFYDENTAQKQAQKGQLDFYAVSRRYANKNITGMDLLHFPSADKLCISMPNQFPGAVYRTDGLPVGNPITAQKSIRHAINVGIDRQSIVDSVLSQYGKPAYDLVDSQMPWYNDQTTYEDANPKKAKEILKNDGWQDNDSDGILEKNYVNAHFLLYAPSDNHLYKKVAYTLSEQVKPLGIQIDVHTKPWRKIDDKRYAHPFVVMWGALSPIDIAYLHHSANQGRNYMNSVYYENPVVDQFIENALESQTTAQAYQNWKNAQWNGKTGFSTKGDAPWLWIADVDHIFRIKTGLNIGKQNKQQASNGWAILHNIYHWHWDMPVR